MNIALYKYVYPFPPNNYIFFNFINYDLCIKTQIQNIKNVNYINMTY